MARVIYDRGHYNKLLQPKATPYKLLSEVAKIDTITQVNVHGLVVKLAYHASLSRRRSPVRIRSGPPS